MLVDKEPLIKAILEFWSEEEPSLKKRVLLLTGVPGVGKTTVLLRTVDVLKTKGYSVGGMISREVRSDGARVGFEILDLSSGKRGWLARANQESGPRVGKYRVHLSDLETTGANAVVAAAENCDVVVIDEIGPMEMFSERFKLAVKLAVDSGKLVVGVIHWKTRSWLTEEIRKREDTELFEVIPVNRDKLHEIVAMKGTEFLQSEKGTR